MKMVRHCSKILVLFSFSFLLWLLVTASSSSWAAAAAAATTNDAQEETAEECGNPEATATATTYNDAAAADHDNDNTAASPSKSAEEGLAAAVPLPSSSSSSSSSAAAAAEADSTRPITMTHVSEDRQLLQLANAQLDWLEQAHGGMVASELIHITPTTTHSSLGWAAKADIPKDTVLMKIPRSALLRGDDIASRDPCRTAERLVREFQFGAESTYAPYVQYLYHAQRQQQPSLPAYWSKRGKDILENILGNDLPPTHLTKNTYKADCLGVEDGQDEDDDDKQEDVTATSAELQELELAYAILTSRAWWKKDILVPVLDMMNHGNGDLCNVDSTSIHDDTSSVEEEITVFAKRDIVQGEPLHMSYSHTITDRTDEYEYNQLTSDNNNRIQYTTPELLRDFGFVDKYPQRWNIPVEIPAYHRDDEEEHPQNLVFDVVVAHTMVGDNTAGIDKPKVSYNVTWHTPADHPPTHDYVLYRLRKEFARIHKLTRYVIAFGKNVPSDHERQVIQEFYRSLYTAFNEAIQSITGEAESNGFDDVYNNMACEDFELIWVEGGEWEFVEEVMSHHQEVQIYHRPTQDDACLLLGNYLHACASNRPHYHEVFVHYPARFLKNVKRVLFIGGGDSMVLHEVLKYDDLEKVVGLELDQQVVRTVFNRFGTQPHFENDKVEWYFGDAAAALRAVPKEYYGTFDLVVVDILTRVAEILRVTEEYSIMEAAMLLLQPNGIIIKNEDEGYQPGSSANFTKHMVDVVYHDVPVYCLQTFVMGSNGVDFAKTTPIDHDIPLLYLKPVDEFQAQFDTWYTTSTDPAFLDNKAEAPPPFNPVGLTMIIEAEETLMPLESSFKVQALLSGVLENYQLSQPVVEPTITHLASSWDEELKGAYSLHFLFKEGSIVTRCLPVVRYCAFDIQLWSDLYKMDGIKNDLVNAVKSQKSSAFRIVTSGLNTTSSMADKVGPPSRVVEDNVENEAAQGQKESSSSFVEMSNSTIEWRNATLHSYDNKDALVQWKSQEIVGVQSILQFKVYPGVEDPQNVTKALKKTFKKIFKLARDKDLVPKGLTGNAHEIDNTGKGGNGYSHVYTATWDAGNMVALWDGSSQLDINLFSLTEEEGFAFELIELFKKKLKKWPVAMAESFPRGLGRIINFLCDYESRDRGEVPYWA